MSIREGDPSAESTSEQAAGADSTAVPQSSARQPGEDISQWLRPDAPEPVRERVREMEPGGGRLRLVAALYEGPLPPAAEFAGYEATLPGAADRILGMAETEQELRVKVFKGTHVIGVCRVVAATIIPLSGLAVSAFGYYLGHPGFALLLGLAGFMGLAYRLLRPSADDEVKL